VTSLRRPSLVEQVREQLLERVQAGQLVEGDKLPNEYELADQFQVSRATVREAILALVQAGHLTRQRGNGTFVAAPPSRHSLNANVSYTEMIREAGHEPSETVLKTIERGATPPEAAELGLDPGLPVIEVERIRSGDGRPLIYSLDRLPAGLLGAADHEALTQSLYRALEGAGHRVARATAHLLPTVADTRLARLLEVRRGAPLLHIRQVDRDDAGRPLMLSDEWHVADAFDLLVERSGPPPASG
jgi:GntR family transcriptional regulator